MQNTGRLIVSGLVLGAAILLAASASAQTYGTANLFPGFGMQALNGVSGGVVGAPGGEIDASTYGNTPSGGCRGWIAPTPDHTMTLTSHMAALSIQVTSTDGGDTSLVIVGPGGTFCNDDNVALHPGLTGSFPAGTYSLWIGSYVAGSNHPYSIVFQDLAAPVAVAVPIPTTIPAALTTTSMTPADPMGMIILNTGFMPDPQTRTGTLSGTISMSGTPNLYGGTCVGYVNSVPSHIMNLTSPFSYLRVHVQSPADTTLVIQDPTGGFWCNDDADAFNPIIDGPWTPGMWRIWVGTYAPATIGAYSIQFTEFAR